MIVVPFQIARAGADTPSASVPVDPGHLLHVKANITELPVPPTVPSNGKCTNATGCVSAEWGALDSPGFFGDPHYVLLGVTFAGAPAAPDPRSIYSGPQVLLVNTDGTTFPNGDAWKCLTCGAAFVGEGVIPSFFTYPPPHALPGDQKVLVGNAILECTAPDGTAYQVSDTRCTPDNTHIYPIYWAGPNSAPPMPALPLGASTPLPLFGNGREWRLSPDGVHLAWDILLLNSTSGFAEYAFEGALSFDAKTDPKQPRYNLTNVYLLPQPSPWAVRGSLLSFAPRAMIGELRGWTSDGRSVLGIQDFESDSIDAWATSLANGDSESLTDHAEYTDPMFMSPNGKWLLAEQVIGSGRLDFISGMQGIPPLTDLLGTGYVSQMRNNRNRRFFLPWLVNPARSQSEQINAGGDPNWNAAADPVWLADSTAVVWDENLACGANAPYAPPSHCPDSTEPGGRNSRVMIARFPTLPPSTPVAPAPISDTTPAQWAISYSPGQQLPALPSAIPAGTYTLEGRVRGSATVVVTDFPSTTTIQKIAVSYANFSDYGRYVINGTESVQSSSPSLLNPKTTLTWMENLTQSGLHTGAKLTGSDGLTVGSSLLFNNDFEATGTMMTTIDGQTFTQPANGA
jgi:hypothetical protein